jgi:hypothetical protein
MKRRAGFYTDEPEAFGDFCAIAGAFLGSQVPSLQAKKELMERAQAGAERQNAPVDPKCFQRGVASGNCSVSCSPC